MIVDGEPVENLQVIAHPVAGMDRERPTITQGVTVADGSFELSTYQYADGAPPGEYRISFVWQRYNAAAGGFEGEDKFRGRYDSPDNSEFLLTVEKGSPVDMGRIELSTK